MALFQGIKEYIALDVNNITLVFDSGNIVKICGNIYLYYPQGHPILYNYCPPCYKARGIHDFILATKSPMWIIISIIVLFELQKR